MLAISPVPSFLALSLHTTLRVKYRRQESVRRNWIPIGVRFDPPKTLETLVEAGLATSPVSSNKAAYAAALARYKRLVRIGHTAEMISRWCKAFASRIWT